MSDPQQVDPLDGRSEWSNWIILIVLALAMFFIFYFRPFGGPDATSHPAVGQKLPSLMLMPLTGDSQPTALRNLSGQVVLVNFWGTWCPPCRTELPHIAAIEEKYRGRNGFQLLAVSCGPGGPENVPELRDDTAAMLKRMRIDMPTYTDPDEATRAAYDSVGGFDGYPTTFVLDGQGVIRGAWSGFRPGIEHEMEELIGYLLSNRGN